MTCHRDGARHCSCAPEPAGATGVPDATGTTGAAEGTLLLRSPDPRAHAALRALVAPLEAEVVVTEVGTSHVTGDVGAVLLAAAAGLPVTAPAGGATAGSTAGPTGRRPPAPEPAPSWPDRAELLTALERELRHQRAGTTTALLFCAVGDGTSSGAVLDAVTSRLRARVRGGDVVAHLGGGRFAAVLTDLPQTTGDDAAARVVAAVRGALAEPVATVDGLYPLRFLVGVLVHPGPLGGAPGGTDGWGDEGAERMTAPQMLTLVEGAMERGSLPAS